jgi:hypothetical protein
MGVGYSKVLIPNPDYKGKGHTESILSNPAPRMERRRPPIIYAPPRTMEFSDDDTEEEEEEEEERSDELVVTLKERIASLQEQVTELHLAVYDQKNDFDILCKTTTSKLKCFAKVLGNPLLYNAPSP